MTEWIKCSDRLPEEFTAVLVYFKTGGITVCELREKELHPRRWYIVDFDEGDLDYRMDDITHWAKLPEPPSVDS